jgi:hypothetical protein
VKEALEYLFGRLKDKRPVTHKVDEQEYEVKADGTLGEPVRKLEPQWTKPAFLVATLSGLAELVKAHVDEFPTAVALYVRNYLTVELVDLKADDFGSRHVYARASHEEGAAFKFNQFLEAEDFLISFRRSFLYNDEAVKVQQLCSNLSSGMTVNLADDGASQALEVKASTTSSAKVTIPAEGISLIPWRTFRDAAQVESKFLLRFKGVKDGLPQIALFEIDQTWKLDAMNSIADWLKAHTKDVTVIA